MKIFIDTIFNLGTIIAFGIIPSFVDLPFRNRSKRNIIYGFLFGIGAVIGMLRPVMLQPGLFFDGRSVLVGLSGFFFGPVSAMISACIVIAVRLYQGGTGSITGSFVILSSAILGILFFGYHKKEEYDFSLKNLFIFGLIVHASMLLLMFTLPGGKGIPTLKIIGLPIIVIYPLATIVVGKVLSLVMTRNKMMAALRESEDIFRYFMEHNPIYVFFKDENIRALRLSKNYETLLGKPLEQLLGKNMDELFPSDFAKRMVEDDKRVLNEGKIISAEEELNGRFYTTIKFPIFLKEKPQYLAGYSIDITEQKLTNENLIKAHTLLQRIIDLLPIRIFWKDKDLRFLGCNEIFAKDAGKNRAEDLIGQDDYQMSWKEQAKSYQDDDLQVMKSGAPKLNFEEPQTIPNGNTIWLKTSKVPLTDEQGNTIGILGAYEDITERKLAEEALKESEEKYRLITERINDVVWLMDLSGKSLFVSPSIEKFTGYTVDEYLNQSFTDRFTPESASVALETFKKEVFRFTHLEKPPKNYQQIIIMDYRCKNGSIKTGEVLITPSFDNNNICIGLYGVTRDITERKQAQIALKQLNDNLESRVKQRTLELENSNKALESFSYSVSHDLRAPLRAINGFSELLVSGYQERLGSNGSRLLRVIIENSSRMDKLIKGMLAISRVSSSEINKKNIDMNQLVKSVYDECVSAEDKDKTTLQITNLEDGYGDPVLIRQIWTNLLENALKFTKNKEKPAILIKSIIEDHQIIYSIQDNGAGFNPDYKNKLFQVFQRLHNSAEFEGTGIGLAIVERIVRRHGGSVWAEGKEGCGATFYFSLPIPELSF